MTWTFVKTAIAAAIIVADSEISQRMPRLGARLLTLPIESPIAFVMSGQQHREYTTTPHRTEFRCDECGVPVTFFEFYFARPSLRHLQSRQPAWFTTQPPKFRGDLRNRTFDKCLIRGREQYPPSRTSLQP